MTKPRIIRLLVVEDNASYLYLVQKAFAERSGTVTWELTIARDAEAAVGLLFAEESEDVALPDLILLDWNLPVMSGGELLGRLKGHPQLRRIPVLVFSSSEDEEDVSAAYDAHANGYITKPASVDVLASIVETIEHFWIAIARLPKPLEHN